MRPPTGDDEMDEAAMPQPPQAQDGRVIRGAFHTDGETFVFTIADTPISGVGATPQEAYADLLRVEARAGALPERLRDLAREQAGAAERASLIRMAAAGLIALTVIGGALGGAAALAPRVAADIADTMAAAQEEARHAQLPEAP